MADQRVEQESWNECVDLRVRRGRPSQATTLRALADLVTFGLSERLLASATIAKRARPVSAAASSTNFSPQLLVVGLGNPGAAYARTRHNAGQLLLAELFVAEEEEDEWQNLDGARVLESPSSLGEGRMTLAAQPASFMNLSGRCVQKLCSRYNIPPGKVLVLHDDLDLPLGKVKMKLGGSTGGHRGLDSIAQHLKSPDFHRLRIGIGRPANKADVPDFVLEAFSKKEMEQTLSPLFARLVECRAMLPAAMESEGSRSTLLNALTGKGPAVAATSSKKGGGGGGAAGVGGGGAASASASASAASTAPADAIASDSGGSAPSVAREQSYGATSLAAALPDEKQETKATTEADADEGDDEEVEPLPRSTRQRSH